MACVSSYLFNSVLVHGPGALQQVAGVPGDAASGVCKALVGRCVENRSRRIHDDVCIRSPAGPHRGHRVTALRADTGDEQRQGRCHAAHAFDLCRVGGAHHQTKLAIAIPRALGQSCDVFVQQRLAVHRCQALVLQVITTGVGCAAEQKRALAVVLQVGLDGIKTHEGRQRDRVGTVAFKRFNRVLAGGAADVAALGVEDDGDVGCGASLRDADPTTLGL